MTGPHRNHPGPRRAATAVPEEICMKAAFLAATATAAAALLAQPAAAQGQGRLQVRLLGTAVLPDGEISEVDTDLVGLPATLQTEASDNYVPTLAVEYFVSDNFSVETICCMTQHDVDGTTGLPGAELVADGKLIPATITLKAHLDGGWIKPYVGAGPAYFWWVDVDTGAAAAALGVTETSLSDEFGVALQAGVDFPIEANGWSLSVDAKKYFIGTTARWFVDGTKVIETEHKLDPWVLSAGVGYRF